MAEGDIDCIYSKITNQVFNLYAVYIHFFLHITLFSQKTIEVIMLQLVLVVKIIWIILPSTPDHYGSVAADLVPLLDCQIR